jgi:branched-chain amino acid transport system permease protein
MKTKHASPLQNGLSAGAIFGILSIFFMLTGFNETAANLVGRLLRNQVPNQMPAMINLIVFLALMSLWCGSMAAKKPEQGAPDRYSNAVFSGLVAGALAGLITALFVFVTGSINEAGTDIRGYFPKMAPAYVRFYLFNLPVMTGAIYHFAMLLVGSTLGALMSRGVGRSSWRVKLNREISDSSKKLTQNSTFDRILNSKYSQYGMFALLAAALIILPREWGPYWNYLMGTVGIYILLGIGLNIIVGLSGQLVLGYVAFFGIGAYTFGLLTSPQPHAIMMNFWLALLAGVALASVTGILLGLPIMRLRGDYLAIVTLGFGEIIRILLKADILEFFTAGPKGLRSLAQPTLFGKSFSSDVDFMYLIILAVIISIFIANRIEKSRIGRAWISIREDAVVSQATGVDTVRYKLLALAIGAAFAGLAGAMFASRNQFTGPEDHILMVSINVLCLVIVGGMGSIPGIILGSFVLKGLPEILREFEAYRMLAFGALLVVMMIIRPEGLLPSSRPNYEGLKPDIKENSQGEVVEDAAHS